MINNINILYEDTQILVCVKPAGVATQSKRIGSPDMVSLLKNHISMTSGKSGEPYLAVIHRLDQPVSGILVFAKTPAAAKDLNRQLTTSGFGKHYYALVAGTPEPTSADLENFLVKDARTNTSRICQKGTANAKLAKLHYDLVDTTFFADIASAIPVATSQLKIKLDTGRHHQIRVQLSGMGCPIIGDTKYNPDSPKLTARRTPLCLCAYQLDLVRIDSGPGPQAGGRGIPGITDPGAGDVDAVAGHLETRRVDLVDGGHAQRAAQTCPVLHREADGIGHIIPESDATAIVSGIPALAKILS